ncbi:MAG: 4-hydroxy-tetrahydrodipicolinate synthase [Firmicutes bacterium]|nr:4-hydroxy-tetrahydrodipicolinate synthase [Bacillota bacterium]
MFGQLLTAMVTVFKRDYSVDYRGSAEMARRLLGTGSDGLVITGTTGEAPTLTDEEKIRLWASVREAVGNKGKVLAGTGTNDTLHAVRMSQEAARIGMDGLLVVTPYYNKPPQEGLYDYFRQVAEATPLPVILYNVPGRTGVNLLPETVLKLAAIPNVVAVKEASGSPDQAGEILGGPDLQFTLYSGDDSLTLPLLAVGGHGVISVASHLVGREMKSMIEAYAAGRVKDAAALHQRLLPLFKVLFLTANPIPVKAALRLVGFDAGPLRSPLTGASGAVEKAIKEVLQELGLLP